MKPIEKPNPVFDRKPTSNEIAETDWFDGKKFVPHHVGVYEKRFREGSGSVYQHWNGKFWGQYSTNVARALGYKDNLSDYQNLDWRGLRYGSVEGSITE